MIASAEGRGFVMNASDMVASTKSGKQILTGSSPLLVCTEIKGDHIACVGENRKMLIYPISELPQLAKGKGVILQKYKDGGLCDATTFTAEEGLTWAGRMNSLKDFTEFTGGVQHRGAWYHVASHVMESSRGKYDRISPCRRKRYSCHYGFA